MGNKSKSKNVYHFSWGAVASLVAGLGVGGALITFGIINNVNSDYSNMVIRDEATIEAEVDAKYQEIRELRVKRNEEYEAYGETDAYRNYSSQIAILEQERSDLEDELYKATTDFYADMKADTIGNSVPYIVAGTIIALLGLYGFWMIMSKNKSKILSAKEDIKVSLPKVEKKDDKKSSDKKEDKKDDKKDEK